MKILIRCDSSVKIGSGHMVRCTTLASQLSNLGHTVHFLCRKLNGNINDLAINKGFLLTEIDLAERVEEAEEILATKTIISNLNPDWIIVDHYKLGYAWEKFVRNYTRNILAIDDIFRKHTEETILLDQNFHYNHKELWNIPQSQRAFFLGPEYALTDISIPPPVTVTESRSPYNILSFFGGSDELNASELLLKSLFYVKGIDFQSTTIIGNANCRFEMLKKKYSNTNVNIIKSTRDFHGLLSSADLFISAGGSTLWERSYFGIPGIVVSVADNQVSIAKSLHGLGAHQYLGAFEEINEKYFGRSIKELLCNSAERKRMALRSLEIKVSSRLHQVLEVFN